MKELIFVLDDEPDILELLSMQLNRNDFDVMTFSDHHTFWKEIISTLPSLCILDWMLPETNGLDICKALRSSPRYSDLPVIILSARRTEMDRILGLELGADDYITKPFSTGELIARIRAILRRKKTRKRTEEISFGSIIRMNIRTFETWINHRKVTLTTTEFRILRLLIEKQGWVFTREQILETLWGRQKEVIERTVDVHIKNLREKMRDAGKLIINVRGVGYKIEN